MRVWLFDSKLTRPFEAWLVPMTDDHVAALNSTWVPAFHRRQELSEKDQDFLMWKTGVRYVDLLTQHEGVYAYVVTRTDAVEGVLALQESPEASRMEKGERVLIVRYLAAAPWNRNGRTEPRRYGRTGTVLLGRAVLDSMAAGCLGRLALHSLTASDEFYRKLGFSDLGPDPAERGLRYFELSAAGAARLLRGTSYIAEPRSIFQPGDDAKGLDGPGLPTQRKEQR